MTSTLLKKKYFTASKLNIRLIYIKGKRKSKDPGTYYSASYVSQTRDQKRFTIVEVAADWHELMTLQYITQPSIARASEQWDMRCSQKTYHRPNQSH